MSLDKFFLSTRLNLLRRILSCCIVSLPAPVSCCEIRQAAVSVGIVNKGKEISSTLPSPESVSYAMLSPSTSLVKNKMKKNLSVQSTPTHYASRMKLIRYRCAFPV